MKILQLEVQNVKGIEHVVLNPEGNFVVVAGDNEQGKSSFLDGVMYLFCGKGKIPCRVLRDGATNGFVEAIIGDALVAKVTRKFGKNEKTQLIVTSVEGKSLQAPQDICKELMGGDSMTYDPTAFQLLSPKKQVDLVRSLDPDLDFTDLDERHRHSYEARTDKNKDIKRLEGKLESMPPIPADLPKGEISISDLSARITKAHAANRGYDEAKSVLQKYYDDYGIQAATVKRLEAELFDAETALAQTKADGKAQKELVDGMVVQEVGTLETQLQNAESTNQQIRSSADARESRLELKEARSMADELTADLEAIKGEKENRLSDVSFPIPGMAFNEDGITINGLPFDEEHMSSGELFRISTQMAIHLNHSGILICRLGSLLDTKNRQVVKTMAEEAGLLCLFEVIGEDEDAQLVISDGRKK